MPTDVPDTPTTRRRSHAGPRPLWDRALFEAGEVRRRDRTGLPFWDTVRVLWWTLRLTPGARLRAARFRQEIRDGRGPTFSVRAAKRATRR